MFVVDPIVCGGFVLDPCLVWGNFLVLQSSRWGREGWLLFFCSECDVAVIVL